MDIALTVNGLEKRYKLDATSLPVPPFLEWNTPRSPSTPGPLAAKKTGGASFGPAEPKRGAV